MAKLKQVILVFGALAALTLFGYLNPSPQPVSAVAAAPEVELSASGERELARRQKEEEALQSAKCQLTDC
jgi:hypothetical protein